MGHVFGPKWIRLKTPLTSDGRTLVQDDTGRTVYTEMDIPLSARKIYERENSRLAKMYQHIFVEMDESMAPNPDKLVKGAGKNVKNTENAGANSLV